MSFKRKIEEWYDENGRTLPWRGINDPYKIWVSEIILQQTRIEQGWNYYLRFIDKFPTVKDLADAPEEDVLKCWQGLGYYSRARNMHSAAKYIMDEFDGKFPNTYEDILSLKGVGRYTAAAISSMAFGLPYPVIDGNVYRLISRVFGIYTPIGTDVAYKEFEKLLMGLIDKDNPGKFNQAMMDFGSLYCKPLGCECENCIFLNECVAFKDGKVEMLPIKPEKVVVKERWMYYMYIHWNKKDDTYTFVHKREGKDIWKGLYEFPLIESEFALKEDELLNKIKECVGQKCDIKIEKSLTHKLTHRTIKATFIKVVLLTEPIKKWENEQEIPLKELKKLPVSRLIDRYLNKK